ncbi:MAG: hypothetical protein K2K90_05485 [Lachnospiraceae bacterium]|nr:hypothetical protein [Lachnospiraceae bacterium]
MEDETVSDGGISGNDTGEEKDGEEEKPSLSENSVSISQNSLSIKANNSLGSLLLEDLQFEVQNTEAEAAASYAVVDVEVSGTKAEVLLHAKEDCTVVVAIYEEGSERPYAFGSAAVDAGENRIVVEIEAASLPQYFEAKGYLVDTDTLRPLSREYNSLMYTKAMQEFLDKTADDFGTATVINLDEDRETNFLVLNDGYLLIKEELGQSEGDAPVDQLLSYEEESGTYIFGNVSDSVKGLKQGDIFLYQYGESKLDVYIIKVEKIELQETDGVSAAIIVASKEELGAEEIFRHVRIDQVSGTSEMNEITQADCAEGVTYLGRESTAVGYASVEGEGKLVFEKDTWALKEELEGSLGAGSGEFKADLDAEFGVTFNLHYYLDWQLAYIDINGKISAGVYGEVEAKGGIAVPILKAPLETKGGENNLFILSYTPKFFVSAAVSWVLRLV